MDKEKRQRLGRVELKLAVARGLRARRRDGILVGAMLIGALWTLSIPAAPLQAQNVAEKEDAEEEEADHSELAKAAQNPLASLISLPFQNNTSFGIGDDPISRTSNVLNIQPVIPFELSSSFNLITRTILPIVSAPTVDVVDPGDPSLDPGIGSTTWGLGDLLWTGWFVPTNTGPVMVGVGPALLFPTGTSNETGTGKWAAGPSVVFVATPGSALLGFLVNNIWSYAGPSDRGDVNQMVIQYFINYNLPKGWYLSSAPIITANWEAPDGRKWIVPFGGGGGKVFKIGKQPINSQIQAFYNAVTPTDNEGDRVGPEWSLRLQFQLLFPK